MGCTDTVAGAVALTAPFEGWTLKKGVHCWVERAAANDSEEMFGFVTGRVFSGRPGPPPCPRRTMRVRRGSGGHGRECGNDEGMVGGSEGNGRGSSKGSGWESHGIYRPLCRTARKRGNGSGYRRRQPISSGPGAGGNRGRLSLRAAV